MKRSPLRRFTPLRSSGSIRRGKPMRRRRAGQRRSGRVRNTPYMLWVKTLPCCVRDGRCRGHIEAHHAGERPFGRKANDDTCIPLCKLHHDEWDAPMWSSGANAFRGWTPEQRRAWQDEKISETRALWDSSQGTPAGAELVTVS